MRYLPSSPLRVDGENYNASICSMLNPVALEMISSETPICFRFRAVSSLPSSRPSSRPSFRPFCSANSSVTRLSRYTLMLSSYFIRSSFESEAISTIFSNFSKTDLRALNGRRFKVYIFFST